MRRRHRSVVAGFVAVVLVVSLVGTGVATASPTEPQGWSPTVGSATALTQSGDDTIDQTQTYALTPSRPGEVSVTLTYEIPDRVTALAAQLPANTTVTSTDGFEAVNGTTYEWDETTTTAIINLRYEPNETVERTGREAAVGEYQFVDTGEWALFPRIETGASWSYTGTTSQDPVTFERSVTTDGPGATGGELVYLGEYSTVEREADGQTFRLVVPERAELDESSDAILDSLETASASFDVGDRDEAVFVVAAPTGDVTWGVRGLEYGGSDMFVRDNERLDDPANVWLHEYVHSRQAFAPTRETRWLTEGTAVYYAALLTLEQERITFAEFSEFIDDGARPAYDDVVLSDPGTWTDSAQYIKGPLAAGRIDEAMREETDQTGTFEETVARLNGVDGRVTQAELLDAVEDVGGPASRTAATDYTETTAGVTMWNDTTHSRLFGQLPADVRYALPNESAGYRVSGPYRNGTVGSPVSLAAGETLRVDALVANDGGAEGDYNATLTVDGSVVDSATGTVAAGGERTVPLSHSFAEAGTDTVGVGGETVTVTVEPPAEPTVSTLTAETDRVQAGNSTNVTATVRNDAAVPANGTVVLTRGSEPVATEVVTLGPGNATNVTVTVAFPDAGEIPVAAGSATPVTVSVFVPTAAPTATAAPSPAAGAPATTGGGGAGFTALAALSAVTVALWWVGRSR
jgi:hypothetical protein